MLGLDQYSDALLRGCLLTLAGLILIMVVSRTVGLRTFSKMTAFDFVVTLAAGSLLATIASAASWTSVLQAAVALVVFLAAQFIIAKVRRGSEAVKEALENKPVLLMRDGVIDEGALVESRVARSDLIAKLREANVLDFSSVRAVILETTGDISVLHGDQLDEALLEGVRTR